MSMFKSTAKEIWEEGICPFLFQLVIIAALVALFVVCVNAGSGDFLIAQHQEGGELSSPTLGRFIYMIASLAVGVGAAVWADSAGKQLDSRRKMFLSYYIGIVAGTLLWQSVGECSWHFGVQYFNEAMGEDVTIFFPRIECLSSLFLFVVVLALVRYSWRKKAFSWGVWCVIISFMANWIGHFIMVASYPFLASYFSEPEWFEIIGLWGGLLIILYSLFVMLFRVHNIRGRLSASMMIYCGVAMIASGVTGI